MGIDTFSGPSIMLGRSGSRSLTYFRPLRHQPSADGQDDQANDENETCPTPQRESESVANFRHLILSLPDPRLVILSAVPFTVQWAVTSNS